MNRTPWIISGSAVSPGSANGPLRRPHGETHKHAASLNGPQGNIRVISMRFRPGAYVFMDPAQFLHLDTNFGRQKCERQQSRRRANNQRAKIKIYISQSRCRFLSFFLFLSPSVPLPSSLCPPPLLLSNDTVAQAQRLNPKDLWERICLHQAPSNGD